MALFSGTALGSEHGQRVALGETVAAFHELEQSAPRVAAIVGCALLDDQIRLALLRRFVPPYTAHKKFFSEGPGHETNSKILIAHALGIFTSDTRDNLLAIASIRNKFAHNLKIRDFEHSDLTDHFKKITAYKRAKSESPDWLQFEIKPVSENSSRRTKFVATVHLLHMMFVLDPFFGPIHVSAPRF